jgi:hypothetical protein
MKAKQRVSLASVITGALGAAWYLVAFVLVATVVAAAAGWAVGIQVTPDGAPSVEIGSNVSMAIPIFFQLDGDTAGASAPSLGIAGARVDQGQGILRFPARTGRFFLANLGLLICSLGIALWVLWTLRALFRTLREGKPFAPANAGRIRQLGWAVILGEALRSAVIFADSHYVATYFSAPGVRFEARPDFSMLAILHGLIVLAIAEVFRKGTRLEEEQSLTI